MVAGLAQTLIITPVDLLKIRQQIQTSLPGTAGYVGPVQLLLRVVRREGVAGRVLTSPAPVSHSGRLSSSAVSLLCRTGM